MQPNKENTPIAERTEVSHDRRKVVKDLAGFAGKLAVAGLPFMLSSLPKKANAQTTTNAIDTLNHLLLLAYLQQNLYQLALDATALQVPLQGANRDNINTFYERVNAQIDVIKSRITALGGSPIGMPAIDWTGGSATSGPGFGMGSLKDSYSPFANVAVLFALSQALTDLFVRATKAVLYTLMNHDEIMKVAMRIQAAQARTASHIRQMRRDSGLAVPPGVNLKPWITKNESGILAPTNFYTDAFYASEYVTDQDQVDLLAATNKNASTVSEAFDEPLALQDVLYVLDSFLA